MNDTIDFKGLADTLLRYSSTILPDILSGGKLVGKEWTCGDITGQAGSSFKFNIETGTFKDFSSNDGGKDLIALYSKQKNISMLDSAKYLREKYLSADPIVKYNYPTKQDRERQEIVKPPIDVMPPQIPQNATSWCYKDESGDPLFYIVRQENNDGKKFFYPFTFTNKNEWIKKHYPNPPLYNLDKLAKDLSKPVLIVEGEKSAEAASVAMKVYITTTWPSGANAWNKADWSVLKGRKVLLWPDADSVGRDCMNNIARHLLDNGIATEVKMINSDKEDGWDAHDAFVKEAWDYKRFAEWAKPLATLHTPMKKVEIITQDDYQNEIEAKRSVEADPNSLIPTEDFPVSPNMQMRFIELGLQFSDSKQTRVVMNASNVAKIIRADFKDIIWRDVFYGKIFTKWKTGIERQWSDNDTNNLFIQVQHHYELGKLAKQHVQDAIEFVASMNEKNEPQEWLKSLSWDGTKRIDTFFVDAMGASKDEYTFAVSKNFWIALVARIMQAGCKADEMVVLEGKQGTYKTTSLEIIGGKWYGEVNSDISSKDFDQCLKGKILVEFGELANLKKADVEIIKRKLSTRIDEYRPSYGRYVEQHPRTCIFAGTTNDSEYLKDPTGNRRFWPMKIVRADTDYIKEYRDQFFAEAFSRFNSGESWHEVPFDHAEMLRSDRMEFDEWENTISGILEQGRYKTSYFTTRDIWIDMGESDGKLEKKNQNRISFVLKKFGYEYKTTRLNGKVSKAWIKI